MKNYAALCFMIFLFACKAHPGVCSMEYAVAMHRLFPDAQLIILPGTHGKFLGTSESIADKGWKYAYTADIIESFLD